MFRKLDELRSGGIDKFIGEALELAAESEPRGSTKTSSEKRHAELVRNGRAGAVLREMNGEGEPQSMTRRSKSCNRIFPLENLRRIGQELSMHFARGPMAVTLYVERF